MMDFRLPNITAQSEREQLQQIRGYLYQMAGQLQFALGTLSAQQEEAVRKAETAAANAAPKSPAATFNEIKGLIIKSADIVDAYYEETTRRLEGKYVGQSEFGVFSEEMEQAITENAQGIDRAFSSIQKVQSSVSGLEDTVLGAQAYIKTGLLYYDEQGFPVYGLEIGQENAENGVVTFQKYARVTAGRLSFFDSNGTEVAYISDRQLHITRAEVGELTASQVTLEKLYMGEYTLVRGSDGHLTWI